MFGARLSVRWKEREHYRDLWSAGSNTGDLKDF